MDRESPGPSNAFCSDVTETVLVVINDEEPETSSPKDTTIVDRATDDRSFLLGIGQKLSGTKAELKKRADLFKKYPQLTKNYLNKTVKWKYGEGIFNRKLSYEESSTLQGPWVARNYPFFSEPDLARYMSPKLAGHKSMLQKGYAMFKSRKIVTIRTSAQESYVYVRAHVRSSYNNLVTRVAVLKFVDGVATSGNCTCLIGRSGICSHVIAILFQLIHIESNGSALLEKQCTTLPNQWLKKGVRTSAKMVPVHRIKD